MKMSKLVKFLESELKLAYEKHKIPINDVTLMAGTVAIELAERLFVENIEKIALEDGHDLTKTAMLKHRIYTQLDK